MSHKCGCGSPAVVKTSRGFLCRECCYGLTDLIHANASRAAQDKFLADKASKRSDPMSEQEEPHFSNGNCICCGVAPGAEHAKGCPAITYPAQKIGVFGAHRVTFTGHHFRVPDCLFACDEMHRLLVVSPDNDWSLMKTADLVKLRDKLSEIIYDREKQR